MALVIWIAEHVFNIHDLLAYVNDNFSWELAHHTMFYEPYHQWFPTKQARLLKLWYLLRIPHERRKQEFGTQLKIIGYYIDAQTLQISMEQSSRDDLLNAIHSFCHNAHPRRRTLREFQRLEGWINWGLNIQPRLRPGLVTMYEKIVGKTHPFRLLWVSRRIIRDLSWLARHFSSGNGIQLLHAIAWTPSKADLTVYTDASSYGLGLWVPAFDTGYIRPKPTSLPTEHIFYAEAFVVSCAVHWATTLPSPPNKLAIYTDNLNTVNMFNSMKASGPYNFLLRFVVDLLIDFDIDLRVYHISGNHNLIADALSRFNVTFLLSHYPNITINSYTPPPHMVEARSQ
jgi:hypothetical protein